MDTNTRTMLALLALANIVKRIDNDSTETFKVIDENFGLLSTLVNGLTAEMEEVFQSFLVTADCIGVQTKRLEGQQRTIATQQRTIDALIRRVSRLEVLQGTAFAGGERG